jgi:hypothetical protein
MDNFFAKMFRKREADVVPSSTAQPASDSVVSGGSF